MAAPRPRVIVDKSRSREKGAENSTTSPATKRDRSHPAGEVTAFNNTGNPIIFRQVLVPAARMACKSPIGSPSNRAARRGFGVTAPRVEIIRARKLPPHRRAEENRRLLRP